MESWAYIEPGQSLPPPRLNEVSVLWVSPQRVQQANAWSDRHAWLDAAECERVARFRRPGLAARYRLSRWLLRVQLSAWLNLEPVDLHFAQGAQDKPFLPGSPFQFNLSHTDGALVLAFTRERDLGVDVEQMRPDYDYQRLAARRFHPEEWAGLQRLPEAERLAGFYRLWARKEALMKAHGRGLGLSLKRFAVSAEVDPSRLLMAADEDEPGMDWWLCDLVPPEGCVGALALWGQEVGVVREYCW